MKKQQKTTKICILVLLVSLLNNGCMNAKQTSIVHSPSDTPIPTAASGISFNSDNLVVSTLTPKPTSTATPVPTFTSTPTLTSTPTPTETPIPKATKTPKPTKKPSSTKAPATTPTPFVARTREIEDFIKGLNRYVNTTLNTKDIETCATTSDAINKFAKCCEKNSEFGIAYTDVSAILMPNEYLDEIPEVYSISPDLNKCGVYDNCIYVYYRIKTVASSKYDYAIRTGDESFLNAEDKSVMSTIKQYSRDFGFSRMSDLEKIKTVHDYIITHTKYEASDSKGYHTPYGLITNHIAGCDGYADTFKLFMIMNGIECVTVSGTGPDGESIVWNQVNLDGSWYNIDVTWDDPIASVDMCEYVYFLKSDSVFNAYHLNRSAYAKDCISTYYDLYFFDQYMVTLLGDVGTALSSQADKQFIYIAYQNSNYTDARIVEIVMDYLHEDFAYVPGRRLTDEYSFVTIANPSW